MIQLGQGDRADIAQIGDLHRGGFPAQHADPRAARQAVEVDQNVDRIGADAGGGLFIGQGFDPNVMVHRRQHPGADVAAILGRGAIAVHVEPRTVMQFQQFGDQEAHRMAAEIGGEIADADAVMGITRGRGQGAADRRGLAVDPVRPGGGLQRGVVVKRQRRQRTAVCRRLRRGQAGHVKAGDGPGGQNHKLTDGQGPHLARGQGRHRIGGQAGDGSAGQGGQIGRLHLGQNGGAQGGDLIRAQGRGLRCGQGDDTVAAQTAQRRRRQRRDLSSGQVCDLRRGQTLDPCRGDRPDLRRGQRRHLRCRQPGNVRRRQLADDLRQPWSGPQWPWCSRQRSGRSRGSRWWCCNAPFPLVARKARPPLPGPKAKDRPEICPEGWQRDLVKGSVPWVTAGKIAETSPGKVLRF